MNTSAISGHSHVLEPSAWVMRWAQVSAPACHVLDVACGGGRHARWFAARGHAVEAVDRDAAALADLSGVARVSTRVADLEGGPWPYDGQVFGAIVVTHYLHRPLFPRLLEALAPAGVLLYETFAAGNERYGRPANPDFLLKPGELLEVVHGRLHVVAYEDVFVETPKPAMMQRICAVRSGSS